MTKLNLPVLNSVHQKVVEERNALREIISKVNQDLGLEQDTQTDETLSQLQNVVEIATSVEGFENPEQIAQLNQNLQEAQETISKNQESINQLNEQNSQLQKTVNTLQDTVDQNQQLADQIAEVFSGIQHQSVSDAKNLVETAQAVVKIALQTPGVIRTENDHDPDLKTTGEDWETINGLPHNQHVE